MKINRSALSSPEHILVTSAGAEARDACEAPAVADGIDPVADANRLGGAPERLAALRPPSAPIKHGTPARGVLPTALRLPSALDWTPALRFNPAQLYTAQGMPVGREAALELREVRLVPMPGILPPLTSPRAALAEGQARYEHLKASIKKELKVHGLDARRVRFDDVAATVDVSHSLHELVALLPRTARAYLGDSVVRKPAKGLQQSSAMCQSLTRRRGRARPGSEAELREIERALEAHPQPSRAPVLLRSGTANSVLAQFLAQHRGLVVGESHMDVAPRRWLIDGMATMRAQGVTTLYLEHLMETMQSSVLDPYHRAPRGSPLPADLAVYLRAIARNHSLLRSTPVPDNASLAALVEAAHAHGIRVVAVDNDASYARGAAGPVDSPLPRLQHMNHLAATKIATQQAGKWVALVGNAHINTAVEHRDDMGFDALEHYGTYSDDDAYDDFFATIGEAMPEVYAGTSAHALVPTYEMSVPGLAELTGTPAVAVRDGEGPAATVARGIAAEDGAIRVKWDHELALPIHSRGHTRVEVE